MTSGTTGHSLDIRFTPEGVVAFCRCGEWTGPPSPKIDSDGFGNHLTPEDRRAMVDP